MRRVAVLAKHDLILPERHISFIQKIIHLPRVEIAATFQIHADGGLQSGLVVGFRGFRIVLLPLQGVAKTKPGKFQMSGGEIPRLFRLIQDLPIFGNGLNSKVPSRFWK